MTDAEREQLVAPLRALVEELRADVAWRGHPARGSYDDGVNQARLDAADRIHALLPPQRPA